MAERKQRRRFWANVRRQCYERKGGKYLLAWWHVRYWPSGRQDKVVPRQRVATAANALRWCRRWKVEPPMGLEEAAARQRSREHGPSRALWTACEGCDDMWCTLHGMHVADCPCPPVDVWRRCGRHSPYTLHGPVARKAAAKWVAAGPH